MRIRSHNRLTITFYCFKLCSLRTSVIHVRVACFPCVLQFVRFASEFFWAYALMSRSHWSALPSCLSLHWDSSMADRGCHVSAFVHHCAASAWPLQAPRRSLCAALRFRSCRVPASSCSLMPSSCVGACPRCCLCDLFPAGGGCCRKAALPLKHGDEKAIGVVGFSVHSHQLLGALNRARQPAAVPRWEWVLRWVTWQSILLCHHAILQQSSSTMTTCCSDSTWRRLENFKLL